MEYFMEWKNEKWWSKLFDTAYGYIFCYEENEDRINSFNEKRKFLFLALILAWPKGRFGLQEGVNNYWPFDRSNRLTPER